MPQRDEDRGVDELIGSFVTHPQSICGLIPERMWLRCAPARVEVRPSGAVARMREPAGLSKKVEYDWVPPATQSRPLDVCRIEVEATTTAGTRARAQAHLARSSWDPRCSA
ncbi:MAG: hypothetical protein KC731_24370, partial [Myxococcales bacterium]|nr:hypothetical protein [Myxococcales bacterium]